MATWNDKLKTILILLGGDASDLSTDLYDEKLDAIITQLGGDPDDLENNTYDSQIDAILEALGGYTVEALTVTENGTVTAPVGTAYTPVTVNVPVNTLGEKVVSVNENGESTIEPDDGTDGMSSVTLTVSVPQNIPAEVSDMATFLTAENVGKAVIYIGETDDSYVNGDVYIVSEDADSYIHYALHSDDPEPDPESVG